MRINRLDLIAFGRFSETSLDLSDGDQGLHLIYGDNEAGKSTSLRALIGWLFGIPARTRDNFVHANPQLRIGGELQLSTGETIEFIRRKGNKDTLLAYGSDAPLDERRLRRFLPPGIDETIFTRLWGIDHERLIAGGRELLEQSGDLGQALFSAAAGTANLRDILMEMQNSAVDIFKPRGSKAVLNRAISDYKDALKRIREATLPVSTWKALQNDLSGTSAAIAEVEKKIDEKNKQKSGLERINRVKGALAQRRNCLAKMETLGTVLLLPEDFSEQLKTAAQTLQHALDVKERLTAKRDALNKESGSLRVREDLLKNEDTILRLYKDLGAVEKTLADRPGQDGKRRLLRNEAQTLLKGIRPDIRLDDADHLRPFLNNKKWISELARKKSLLIQKQEGHKAALKDLQDEMTALESRRETLPQSDIDLTELKAAVASARKAGDIEQRLNDITTQAAQEKSACENAFAGLGKYHGDADALLSMGLPVTETLDRFEKEADDLMEKFRTASQKKQESETEKRQAEQELQALLLKEDVPKIADLDASRKARDQGWSLIKQTYIQQRDVGGRVQAYTSGSDLPAVYEKKVALADRISDRLRLDADQVVKRADLEAKIEHMTARTADLSAELEQIKQARADLDNRWAAIWKPLHVAAGTPREMKQWVVKAERLIEKMHAAEGVSAREKKLRETCDHLKRSMSHQIAGFDASANIQGKGLEALISICEQRIEKEQEARDNRYQIGHSLKDLHIRLKRTKDDLKTVETGLITWMDEWEKAISGLGLKPDAYPETAMETFDHLVSFFKKFDQSEELHKRIYGMDKVKEEFDRRVHAFAESIGIKTEGQDALTIAGQLHQDLNAAREARASLIKITDQLDEKNQEIKDVTITIRQSQEKISELKTRAGVDTVAELVAAGEKSNHKRDLLKQIETLEQELNRNGDGFGIEALEAEVNRSDIDGIAGDIDRISSELRELQSERDTLRDQRQSIQHEVRQNDGKAMAANASEEAEAHLSSITENAGHYLRFQIASLILEQQIEA
ncbi:MAG TPA: AAA family ATPase, partial [Desulfotignum sp.]|nr:AAA family ATPase [Desulfotignum sp.]